MRLSDRIGRRLKLQDLHVLMTVVQAGSMGKAAEQLNTSQPNISRSIAELEHTFGVRLLDRYSQGVEPTEFGSVLLDCGLAVFDDLRQGVRSIEFLANSSVGELRIGANYFLAASFVPAVVERLARRYPRIASHIVAGDGRAVLRRLKARELDLLIAWKSGLYAGDAELAFEPLYEDFQVVVASARSRWAKRRKITLAELLNEPWVLPPPGSDLGAVAMRVFPAAGLDYPRAAAFSFATDVRLNLVATGRFLTICATSALKFPRRRPAVRALPVDTQMDSVSIGIFTLKNRTLNPAAQHFIEHARGVAKLLVGKAMPASQEAVIGNQ
jgi:DNA-binding transcriptional LysR family regulator